MNKKNLVISILSATTAYATLTAYLWRKDALASKTLLEEIVIDLKFTDIINNSF